MFSNEKKDKSIENQQLIVSEIANHFEKNHLISPAITSDIDDEIHSTTNDLQSFGNCIIFNDTITANIENQRDLDKLNQSLPFEKQNILTNLEEVQSVIKSRSSKKSAGYDEMPSFLLKHLNIKIMLFFTILFNHLLMNCYFPQKWRDAIITPIPKIGKDISIIKFWRPISNLSALSKIFEKILQIRIIKTTNNFDIFKTQFGFRSKTSTVHPLSLLQNDINDGLNRGKFTTLVSLDFRAAFDTVSHSGLIYKLIKLGFNPYLIKIIQSFLTNRTFQIKINNLISEKKLIPSGVPQGSVIAPNLFNLFVHDIPLDENVNTLQYADDILLYHVSDCPGKTQNFMNIYLVKLVRFFKRWKLTLNEDKTVCLNIIGKNDIEKKISKRVRNIKISISGKIIGFSNQLRYLGLTFNYKNDFIDHLNAVKIRFLKNKWSLKHLLKSGFIETKIKINIYKIYLRPILTYASVIWAIPKNISSSQMEQIRLIERNILRSAGNFHRKRNEYYYANNKSLYENTNINRIDRYIVGANLNFIEKCFEHSNTIINSIALRFFNAKYKCVAFLHFLNSRNLLFIDKKLLIYNVGYRDEDRIIYNTNQNTN